MSHVAVVGGGPAGLMAADVISAAGHTVAVYDRMPSLGRKFLMAGRGGLNLTHSEDIAPFLSRYADRAPHLADAIRAFPPSAVRIWCEGLGEATFVGTSGRVFPQSMKTSPLLRAWLRRLGGQGVTSHPRHRWIGWNDEAALRFVTPDGPVTVAADAVVLAMGGASWPDLGSDAAWVTPLEEAGITVAPIAPSNCGFTVAWSEHFKQRCAGEPLKRIAIGFQGTSVRGEAIVTATGIEGGAIYALSGPLRDAIARDGSATVVIDIRPDLTADDLVKFLARPRGKQSLSTHLRKAAHLDHAAIGLLNEHAAKAGTPLASLSLAALADLIKAIPVRLDGTADIARAISSSGGIAFDELDGHFMLRRRPGVFAAGEMLDWEAPTGGYLLQACLSTGHAAGEGVVEWLAKQRPA